MNLTTASYCQLGRRKNQQDATHTDDSLRLYIVCDGVGGNAHGELASQAVCLAVAAEVAGWNGKIPTDGVLREMLRRTCQGLSESAIGEGATTLAMLLFSTSEAIAVHVGDSRIYQFRLTQGKVFRSRDHSLVQDMLEAGLLTDEQARTHPRSNIITQAMRCGDGSNIDPAIDRLTDVRPGDIFLLCTDGVWGEMPDDELESYLCTAEPLHVRLHNLACRTADSHDNNSAIAVEVCGDAWYATNQQDSQNINTYKKKNNEKENFKDYCRRWIERCCSWCRGDRFNG